MTLTQYLGTGSVSRGRLTINSQLKTIVSKSPYLNNDGDKQAVIQGVQNLRDALAKVSGLQWIKPGASASSASFVNGVSPVTSFLSSLSFKHQSRKSDIDLDYRSQPRPRPATPTTGSAPTRWAPTTDAAAARP